MGTLNYHFSQKLVKDNVMTLLGLSAHRWEIVGPQPGHLPDPTENYRDTIGRRWMGHRWDLVVTPSGYRRAPTETSMFMAGSQRCPCAPLLELKFV
jgi:hypothetical protein